MHTTSVWTSAEPAEDGVGSGDLISDSGGVGDIEDGDPLRGRIIETGKNVGGNGVFEDVGVLKGKEIVCEGGAGGDGVVMDEGIWGGSVRAGIGREKQNHPPSAIRMRRKRTEAGSATAAAKRARRSAEAVMPEVADMSKIGCTAAHGRSLRGLQPPLSRPLPPRPLALALYRLPSAHRRHHPTRTHALSHLLVSRAIQTRLPTQRRLPLSHR